MPCVCLHTIKIKFIFCLIGGGKKKSCTHKIITEGFNSSNVDIVQQKQYAFLILPLLQSVCVCRSRVVWSSTTHTRSRSEVVQPDNNKSADYKTKQLLGFTRFQYNNVVLRTHTHTHSSTGVRGLWLLWCSFNLNTHDTSGRGENFVRHFKWKTFAR